MKKLLLIVMAALMAIMAGCGGSADNKAADQSKDKQADQKVELHVAAAASLTDVMKELQAEYQKENPNVTLTFNFGSSGALQQAIENGGETDLFYSAGKKQMDALAKADKLLPDTNKDLLVNKVVLIVPAKDGLDLKSFEDLTKPEVKKIAVGGKGVPVGQYTQEIFKNLNLKDAVADKEVLGTDVRQVRSWVETGEVEAGIVYSTDAIIDKDVKIICTAPDGSHKPVIYPAAVIKDTKNPDAAKAFLAFTASDKAKAIFQKYGFEVK